jgi:hypothetical protein
VVKKLHGILNRVPAKDRPDRLCEIEATHAAWCATDSWQEQDGKYAKGLANWLAPTEGRFDESPPDQGLMRMNGHRTTDPVRIPTASERKRMEVYRGLELFDQIAGRRA